MELLRNRLHQYQAIYSQRILFKVHTDPVSSPGKSKAAPLFAEIENVFTRFKYHLRYGTLGFPATTEVVLSTKVIQYGLVDRQPDAAAA